MRKPSAFTTVFNGVKYIFTQIGNKDVIEITAFVSASVVLCLFTIVRAVLLFIVLILAGI